MSVLETAKVWEGARVAVIGCGAVGLSVIQGARIAGASEIRAIDLDERKLEQAMRFGATHTEPGPVDFVFDVVGRARDRSSRARSLLALGRHVRPDRALARRARRRSSTCRGCSPSATRDPRLPRRRPPAAGGLPAARAVGARRQARPRGHGHAHGAARGLERGARGDAERRRDPHGAAAVTLELLRQIVAGEVPGAAVGDLIGMRMVAVEEGRVDLRARRRAAAHEPARDAARRDPLRPRRRARWAARCVSLLDEGEHVRDRRAEDQLPEAGLVGPADRGRRGDQGGADDHASATAASPTRAARSSPTRPRRA